MFPADSPLLATSLISGLPIWHSLIICLLPVEPHLPLHSIPSLFLLLFCSFLIRLYLSLWKGVLFPIRACFSKALWWKDHDRLDKVAQGSKTVALRTQEEPRFAFNLLGNLWQPISKHLTLLSKCSIVLAIEKGITLYTRNLSEPCAEETGDVRSVLTLELRFLASRWLDIPRGRHGAAIPTTVYFSPFFVKITQNWQVSWLVSATVCAWEFDPLKCTKGDSGWVT